MLAAALVRMFWQPASSLTWWAGPQIYHRQQVYKLPRATYVAMFIAIFFAKLEYAQSGYIFAHISMTTQARYFKFAGAIVQRL